MPTTDPMIESLEEALSLIVNKPKAQLHTCKDGTLVITLGPHAYSAMQLALAGIQSSREFV